MSLFGLLPITTENSDEESLAIPYSSYLPFEPEKDKFANANINTKNKPKDTSKMLIYEYCESIVKQFNLPDTVLVFDNIEHDRMLQFKTNILLIEQDVQTINEPSFELKRLAGKSNVELYCVVEIYKAFYQKVNKIDGINSDSPPKWMNIDARQEGDRTVEDNNAFMNLINSRKEFIDPSTSTLEFENNRSLNQMPTIVSLKDSR